MGKGGNLSRSRLGPRPARRPSWPPASAPLGDGMNDSTRGGGPAQIPEGSGQARAPGLGRCGSPSGRQEAQRGQRRWEVGGDQAGREETEKRGGGGGDARAQPTPCARRTDNKQPCAGRCPSGCRRPRAALPGPPGLSPLPLGTSSPGARPPASTPAQHRGPTQTSAGKWSE